MHDNINKVGSIGTGGCSNMIPYDQWYMDLDPTVKDSLGIPVTRVTYDFTPTETRLAAFILDKQKQWLLEAGAIETWSTPPGPSPYSVHSYGGTRMGDDPTTNVTDEWGMAHEVPNLGVMGAAVMGIAGGHNPTLTAQAIAWRTADHVAKNWKSIAA